MRAAEQSEGVVDLPGAYDIPGLSVTTYSKPSYNSETNFLPLKAHSHSGE